MKREETTQSNEELERIESKSQQIEEKLSPQRDFNAILIQTCPLFFVAIAPDGRTLMMNDAMLQALGYTADAVTGKDYLRTFVPERDRKSLSRFFTTLTTSHEPTLNKNRVLTKSERELLVEWHGQQVFKEDGALDFFFGVGVDITERVQTEDLYQSIGNATFILDPEFTIISANRAMIELTGQPEKNLVGEKCYKILHNSVGPPESCPMVKMLASSRMETAEIEVEALDRIHLVSCTPVLDETGQLEKIIHISTDITETKRAERHLEHLTRVLRAVRNVNQLIMRETDRDTLIQRACKLLIKTRGYFNTWIALLDESGVLVATAEGGLGKEFTPMIEKLARGELPACAQRAVAQSGVVATEDSHSACVDCPLALSYAGRGALTARLEHGGKVYGIMSASIPIEGRVNEEEPRLFKEVAGDIAFALHSMELEEKRAQAEEKIRRERESLALVNALNHAANSGDNLHKIIELFDRLTRDLFSVNSGSVYLLSPDKEYLVLQALVLPLDVKHRIEKSIGRDIPMVRVRLRAGGVYAEILREGKPRITNDASAIRQMMAECTENKALRKLVPVIFPTLNRRSVSSVPLIVGGEAIGLVGMSRQEPFSESDLERFTVVGEQFAGILKRKQVEEVLGESEKKYRALLDNINDLVMEMNSEGMFTYVSPQIFDMFGYTQEESIGLSAMDFIHPDDIEKCMKAMETLDKVKHIEYRSKHKDGHYIWVSTSGRYIPDDNGGFRVVSVLRDITERKQAEQAVRESQKEIEFKAALLNFAPIIIAHHDVEDNIVWANKGYLDATGLTLEELKGKKCYDAWNLGQPCNSCPVLTTLKTGESAEHLLTPQNQEHWPDTQGSWLVRSSPIKDGNGKIIGAIETAIDVTERQQAEEERETLQAQLVQSQKLESIGILASGVAHEINNPLTGMINYAYLIEESIKDDEVKKFAQGIMKEGNRIAEIVKNLLSFARQEKQSHSPARMEDIIDASLTLVGAVLRKDQITIEKEIPDDLPQTRCRSQQIQQVIINLLTNARDALNQRYKDYHEDKLVTIRVQSFKKDGIEWLRTTIEDHGTGIPEDLIARIFEPFFTTKSRTEGTGLGLSVSYGIIKEHHGELTVESKPGKYTRFHMDLRVNNGWTIE